MIVLIKHFGTSVWQEFLFFFFFPGKENFFCPVQNSSGNIVQPKNVDKHPMHEFIWNCSE